LLLNVEDIGNEGRRVDATLAIDPLAGPDGRELAIGPIRVVGVVRKRPDGTGFQGRLEAAADLTCSRCLDSYPQRLESEFNLVYRLEVSPAPQRAPDDDLEAAESMTLEAGRINLLRLAEEQVYLALPLKPLCAESCPGLCPTCGIARRERRCGCAAEEGDPRWAALGDLKRRMRQS